MQDQDEGKTRLVEELIAARRRIAELEAEKAGSEKTQQALRDTIDKYRSLFEHASDSIFIVDLATFCILDANTSAARRLGYTPEELLTLELDDIEVTDEAPGGLVLWQSKISGTVMSETVYRRKDGTEFPVEVSSRIVQYGSRQVFQNFVRDITERKRAEAERERLINELNAFAHTVAHDLKNPLSNIMGYLSIIVGEFDTLSREEMRSFLETADRMSYKMVNIIDELLLLASVRKQDEVPIEMLDMAPIVEGALERLSLLIDEYDAAIWQPTPNAWPIAYGHAPWVEEVWANYISNAVKYGGEPPCIELGGDALPGGTARFWVRDNGPGISPEDQRRLFSQYTRLDEARARGHGLGLSIVHRIVEKLGGAVAVESAQGKGSVFSFTLPLLEED
jgi:PAS domain S-box-containing protein